MKESLQVGLASIVYSNMKSIETLSPYKICTLDLLLDERITVCFYLLDCKFYSNHHINTHAYTHIHTQCVSVCG